MFRIASFAALVGVSSKVLRDYDRRGVFRPAWVEPESGYRMYSPAQLPEIRRILGLRELGVGLDEIHRLVTTKEDLRTTLERRRAALEQERRDVDGRLARLGITLDSIVSDGQAADIVLRDQRSELVALVDVADVPGGDVERAFYELESAVRDSGVRAPRPPGVLVGSDRGSDDGIQVFVPIRRSSTGLDSRVLPACRVATVIHRGPYDTLPERRRALAAWLATSGLRPRGPSRILYLQFGAEADLRLPRPYLVDDEADYVTELQVPVA